MKLANPFPLEVRNLFLGCWTCWKCGCNGQNRGGLEIHHIWGRCSDSAFNASVLCGVCHGAVGHSLEEHRTLFKRTVAFLYKLRREGLFCLSPRDTSFLSYVGPDIQGLDLSPVWSG